MSTTSMILLHNKRSCVAITVSNLPDDRQHGDEERTMLNLVQGMMAILPVAFWVTGYVLVSRRP